MPFVLDTEKHMSTLAVPRVTDRSVEQLEQMFRQHYAMLYRTAYSMLHNPADAEDVPQTIFLRLLRRGMPPELETNAKRYLYRAAVNLSLDMIRLRKRQQRTVTSEGIEAPDDSDSSFIEERHRRLAEALAELHPETAQILILRYVHEYSDADIAKLLGVSRGTMAMRLLRSRARLKRLMQESLGEKP
jgi:RNA polymerase sigma-70 factor, ECF subfamily